MKLLIDNQMIKDTYEVDRFLGEGAFAEVYRVKHRFLGRQAMKVFKRVGVTAKEIENMLGEAIMLSRIGHPNIVRVFDANVFESDKGLHGFFTMENVSGGSLEKFWHSYGTRLVPIETSIDLIIQVCRGLSVAHKHNPPIIHRDIKPQNILVGYETDGLRARISDFGLAKAVNPLTLLATAAGTPAFKPPEAFNNSKGDSCSADIWAIGSTLYLLLTDKLPFKMPSEFGWGHSKEIEEQFQPPSSINPDANKTLDSIVRKALSFSASDRYQNASEMLESLEKWVPGHPQTMKSESKPDPMWTKTALGLGLTSPDQQMADSMVKDALKFKEQGRLSEAADTMEEAFNKSPVLRERYNHLVKLWRCGVSM
jgi:serine/threonine protein kinase